MHQHAIANGEEVRTSATLPSLRRFAVQGIGAQTASLSAVVGREGKSRGKWWGRDGVTGNAQRGYQSRARGACADNDKLLRKNVRRLRGDLVFKAHGLLYHSTLGLRAIKTKKQRNPCIRCITLGR